MFLRFNQLLKFRKIRTRSIFDSPQEILHFSNIVPVKAVSPLFASITECNKNPRELILGVLRVHTRGNQAALLKLSCIFHSKPRRDHTVLRFNEFTEITACQSCPSKMITASQLRFLCLMMDYNYVVMTTTCFCFRQWSLKLNCFMVIISILVRMQCTKHSDKDCVFCGHQHVFDMWASTLDGFGYCGLYPRSAVVCPVKLHGQVRLGQVRLLWFTSMLSLCGALYHNRFCFKHRSSPLIRRNLISNAY